MRFNTLLQSILESNAQVSTKKEKWALMFAFTEEGSKCEYYLRPISELTGKKKKEFLTIATPEYSQYGTVWESQYNVKMYYYTQSVYDKNYAHLFVGKKESLEKVKDEFILINSKDTMFTQNLADSLGSEFKEPWRDIIDNL
jgi:hypothetical protein